ncbi:MAG: hypothetical protein QF790_06065 [Gammaproteobacteria bacterium]|nr:hypothetical protein [Gammaproteobacteria bacterium]
MAELYERVAAERRRLRQVRQALTQATTQTSEGHADWAPFYIAIADYFEAAMARLHAQDIRMGEMLRDKADMGEPDNQHAMAELEERLSGNQQHLKQMLAARDELNADAQAGLQSFESAGKAYADYIVANMGHHPGSTNMAQELFSSDDWAHMADVSEADQVREEHLFERVFASVPASLVLTEQ